MAKRTTHQVVWACPKWSLRPFLGARKVDALMSEQFEYLIERVQRPLQPNSAVRIRGLLLHRSG
jgi:hypothetical protein